MTHPISREPINLWYTRCGAATASAIAIRQNWLQAEFAQGGTILHSLRDSDSIEIRNSHYHHKQSGMFREGGNIPPLWAKGFGQDTVTVGITWLDEYQGVLAKAGSGIESVADLKGKRLAIPNHKGAVIDFQRGAAQHGFVTALAQAGLTPKDANFVDVEAGNYDAKEGARSNRHAELEALEAGQVDAIFVRFARGYQLSQNAAYQQVININDLKDPLLRVNNGTPRPVTVDRAFLDKHPDVVARYLAVLLRTASWASQHPQEVIQLLLPENNGATATEAATIADVIGSHGPDVHLHFTPKLSDEYIKGLEVQKNFLRDWGYIKHDFDVSQWIVREPLEEAYKLLKAQPDFTESPSAIAA